MIIWNMYLVIQTTTVWFKGSQMITHKCKVSTPAFFTSNVKTNIEENTNM